MDKIFSARLDEAVLAEMDRVTRLHRLTKKKFLEEAIHAKALELEKDVKKNICEETRGAWNRRESPAETVRKAKNAFRKAYQRRHL